VAASQTVVTGTSETMKRCTKFHQMSCGVASWANLKRVVT
jgi:hypothetical protein